MSEVIHEIAQLIEVSSGFVIGNRSIDALAAFVRQRVERGGFAGVERYLDYLRRHPDSEEWRHILTRITIKESYLFRAHAQFDALTTTVLGELANRRGDRLLRVWCAGCARGEEAATLAIVLADHPLVGNWSWSVLATDVDDSALADARKGIYGRRAVQRVPPPALARHFVRHRDRYKLDAQLRDRIEYRRLNLIDQPLDLAGERFDVIFLRNVLIYFRPELQRRVVESVEAALTPEGTLFLAPSESLLHLDTTLQARDLGGCFCYRRAPITQDADVLPTGSGAALVPPPVTTKIPAPPPSRSTGTVPPAPLLDARLELAVEALEDGHNERARVVLAALRHDYPESAEVRALEGVTLERTGDLEQSVLAFRAALYLAPEMDEVRFLLARTLEGLGRSRAAGREYRTALSGLGPAGSFSAAILGRLGLPDSEQMTQSCLEYFQNK